MKNTPYLTPINPFSKRQAQILARKIEGKKSRQIALELGISEHTVKGHISKIFDVVECITGNRPYPHELLPLLMGDVILTRRNGNKETT